MLKPIISAYEELAVGMADEFSATHSLDVILRDFGEEVEKFYQNKNIIGDTEGALMMNRFEAMYNQIKDSFEELSVNIHRIVGSNNMQKYNALREIAIQVSFVKEQREGQNVRVDESRFNVDPGVTGIRFVEYTFDREQCEIIDSKLIENPGEYGLFTIIDNWTPNITAYVDSVYQIISFVYNARMTELQKSLTEMKNHMDELNGKHFRDSIDSMAKIVYVAKDYVRMVDKNNMYQFIQNSVKNFGIVNQAINYYLNNNNIDFSF